jgi:hypothetical protein
MNSQGCAFHNMPHRFGEKRETHFKEGLMWNVAIRISVYEAAFRDARLRSEHRAMIVIRFLWR